MAKLVIKDLHVAVEDATNQLQPILNGVNLTLPTGEVHAIMGPNGTGKSTLAQTLMGNPHYHVTSGQVLVDDTDLLALSVDERARVAGLFLAMQYPAAIPGITNVEFLRAAINARRPADQPLPITEFLKRYDHACQVLDMPKDLAERGLNAGFSGGEKKRNEILQMLLLQPQFGLLDEIDSGLDIDALKVVANGVNQLRSPKFGALVITHYQRLLNYIKPDVVHIMMGGKIVKSGDASLAQHLEQVGYTQLRDELGLDVSLVDDADVTDFAPNITIGGESRD